MTLLRPLREVTAKEVALYVRLHRLPHRAVPALSTGKEYRCYQGGLSVPPKCDYFFEELIVIFYIKSRCL